MKTRTINIDSGYEAKNIQTMSNTVAHSTTHEYDNKSLTKMLKTGTYVVILTEVK